MKPMYDDAHQETAARHDMNGPDPAAPIADALELAYRKYVLRDPRLYAADVENRVETELENYFGDGHLDNLRDDTENA